MANRPYDQWVEKDIQFYIRNKIHEGMELEYKQTLDIGNPTKNKKLCKVVSGLANAWGGIIIVGLKEAEEAKKGSIPTELTPLTDGQIIEDAARIINDGIIPRIDTRFYPVEGVSKPGKYWIIHVPESLVGPHMVSINGENRYYRRVGFETKKMTAFEIENAYRSHFLSQRSVEKSLWQFKGDNMNQHLKGSQQAWISVVAIPRNPVHDLFSQLSFVERHSIGQLSVGVPTKSGLQGIDEFKPIYEGLLSEESWDNEKITRYYYRHVIYRSGAISIGIPLNVSGGEQEAVNPLWILHYFHDALSFIGGVFSFVRYFGTIEILVVIDGISDLPVKYGSRGYDTCTANFNTDTFSARITATINEIDMQTPLVLKEPMDILFHSFGRQRCEFYMREPPEKYNPSWIDIREKNGKRVLHVPN